MSNMIVKGKLDKIIFDKNGFSILSINKNKVKISIKHNILFKEGMYLEVEGFLEENEKYGRAIIAKSIKEIDEIKDSRQILHVFIKGIGESKEIEIMNFFGEDYLEKLKNNPLIIYEMYISSSNKRLLKKWEEQKTKLSTLSKDEMINYISKNFDTTKRKANEWVNDIETYNNGILSENILKRECVIPYLSTKTGHGIYEQIKNINDIYEIYNTLEELGYPEFAITKLAAEFKFDTIEKIYHNPYLPIEYKMTFEECDKIALNKINFDAESIHRIVYGTLDVLKKNEMNGNSYLIKEVAVARASELLNIPDVKYIESIIDMNLSYGNESNFILHNDRLYRPTLFFAEKKIAKLLYNKLNSKKNTISEDTFNLIKQSFLSDIQKDAVIGLIENKVSVLTGGPGTGKTTSVKILCEAIIREGKTFALASPTGRAAKRLSESTGYEAKTVHRLLEYTGRGKFSYFKRNENNPLREDYIIIDESSMLDIYIMNNLLKAIADKTSVIFIGDADQLPSVGIGSILKDMKESLVIPVYELSLIYRQGKESYIVKNAHNVKDNKVLEIETGTDFSFKKVESDIDVYDFIKKCIYHKKEFQILCPVKNGNLGTNRLNEIMQFNLNPPNNTKREIFMNGKLFREGDKVIQLENNYDKDVFNGEMGIIKSIDNNFITVYYKDNSTNDIKYTPKEFKQIDLSYAISIHKSQGSEFDNVVMVVDSRNKEFISKEIIYTGITRAKKGLAFLSTLEKDFYSELKESNDRATSIEDFLKDFVYR